MNSQQWIESLAQRARQESPPGLTGAISGSASLRRRLESSAPRVPRTAMWLSGGASLLAACVLLTMGMRTQSDSTTSVSQTDTRNPVSVLFSPLNTDSQ